MESVSKPVLDWPARPAVTEARREAWVRPASLAVLVLTAVLYIWGLDRNGYANNYYSAAVVAGTESWKAFFFGAFDAGSFITVDKPPVALWLMELSTRVFGISSWSILLPEALLGVATVGLVMDSVRRAFGPVAGLIAGVVTALTPVAILMFRFNNPDAMLTFLMVAAGWALVRALQTGRTRWLLISAAAIGFAFNTKYLQGYIVLPALVLTYLLFGPPRLGSRLLQLLGAAGVLAVSTGWWMLIVDAIPAGMRPYIGGSTDNSVLNLVLGYDGLGRIFGQGRGGAPVSGGGGFGGGFGGQTGLLRLFNNQIAGEVSWLLPFVGVLLLFGLWARRSAPRTDLARASYVLWGLWLATHFAVFSYASGIFHSYYTIAMAPAVGALAGAGVVEIWRVRQRHQLLAGAVAAAALVPTAWWGYQLLARTPNFVPGLGLAELVVAVAASLMLLMPKKVGVPAPAMQVVLAAGLVAVLLGPAAYAIGNVTRSVAGAIPISGPASLAADRSPGEGRFPQRIGANGGLHQEGNQMPPGARFAGGLPGNPPSRAFPKGGVPGGPAGRAFGGPEGQAGDAALINYLVKNQASATWLVAVASANQGAPIEIATHKAVLAMGGFSGGDSAMTVTKLKQLVASGQLRYVLISGRMGGPQAQSNSVLDWVTQNCKQVSVPGSSTSGLYECSGSAGS